MREIKFRGIDVKTGKWIYGDLVHENFTADNRIALVAIQLPGYYPVQIIPDTAELFISLKDKNGNEIYEGNILSGGTDKCVVVWCDEKSCFCCRSKDWMFQHYFGEDINPEDYEIIGDIHENSNYARII
jgi:hypothetical protein